MFFEDSEDEFAKTGPLRVQYMLGVVPGCFYAVLFGLLLGVGLPLSYWIPWMVSKGTANVGGMCSQNWVLKVNNEVGIQWLGGFNETYHPGTSFNDATGTDFQNIQCAEDALFVIQLILGVLAVVFVASRIAWDNLDWNCKEAPRTYLRDLMDFKSSAGVFERFSGVPRVRKEWEVFKDVYADVGKAWEELSLEEHKSMIKQGV